MWDLYPLNLCVKDNVKFFVYILYVFNVLELWISKILRKQSTFSVQRHQELQELGFQHFSMLIHSDVFSNLLSVFLLSMPSVQHFAVCVRLFLNRAAQLVLKAHKEAVSSLGGNAPSTLGTISTVVAAANAVAKEAAKEIAIAFQTKPDVSQGRGLPMDDLSIMKVCSMFLSFLGIS